MADDDYTDYLADIDHLSGADGVDLLGELHQRDAEIAALATKLAKATDQAMLQSRFNDRMAKRQTAVEEHIARLTGAFKAATGSGLPPKDGDKPTGTVSFLLLSDTERGRVLIEADLCNWLQKVYLQYDEVRLPDCWYRHPGVIEELLCLRHLHAEAYPTGAPADVRRGGDWHDRYRPRVVERVARAAGRCEPSEHCAGGPKAAPPGPVPMVSLHELIQFWMRPDSATAPRPEPTSEELQASLDRFQTT